MSEEKLFTVLNRAVVRLKGNEKALLLDLGDESVRVPLYDIRYLEVRRNYVTVHAKKDITVKSSLGGIEEGLNNTFFRVGRSFIVNLKYINRVTKKEIFLTGGPSIPLPRGFYNAVNRALIERL